MPDCESAGNNTDKCYTVDLKITSDFDKMNNHLKEIVLLFRV
jgi:hypothetical protein